MHCPTLFPATLLVFLPAAARARVVATYLRAGADRFGLGLSFRRRSGFADDVAGFALFFPARRARGSPAVSAARLMQGLLRNVLQEILERQHAGRAAEDVVA